MKYKLCNTPRQKKPPGISSGFFNVFNTARSEFYAGEIGRFTKFFLDPE